ncbi:MAG: S1 domain-containing RNA-binding protein [Liquorilactobacillus hordei]|uniref:RNA-binding protein n=2 Tax=Liquorilactobacillus hordei TaxID=468911 RepID=A0A0R1MCY5_9LACO|nr:S1 domain-containing RNA-binding protein [Liquorilactobacillus hordei]AUJ29189.1 RNA-binding protein S1 [Liquorilactobacillus hordei]KRL05966.1 RNA-binding protein [Liquorilactobacillus hordei DSM 19519]MBZ2406557.1 RNA-binding protein S1 [Liquorilactobacillus hordei]QYH51898.1 RNA-binding protein S1 [Liquorilactobacillus hordei DSM 19519]
MSIEVGAKVTGKVSGITNFGAFVDLGDKKNGLVHISEVSDGYVKDIHDVLSIGDEVTVKVLSIAEDGKISLSIRKAVAVVPHHEKAQTTHTTRTDRGNNYHSGGTDVKTHNHSGQRQGYKKTEYKKVNETKKTDFDSLLSGFLKDSEVRLTSLKRNTEGKRGGRGGRRS